ncbi:MAG: ABC transporter ATP-binding protein [Clostridia bacterium]|nr:ABC transporter ATP-binding protein [Clostridia bacterium]
MEHLLEVKNLKVEFHTYAGIVHAVRGVSFYLDRGETLAIVGESGCGKSVSAQALMGLIPTPPGRITSGWIQFRGRKIQAANEKELAKLRGSNIGMIFQDPMTSLNPTMTIGRQIMEGLERHRGLSRHQARAQALEMLSLVGIPRPSERINHYPHQFSGGMRQRVMIAIALACRPTILIADEPTTALDVTIQAQILELLKSLQKQLETSIILITHDMGVVAALANRIVVMYAGQIVEEGKSEQVFYNPQHPYTLALLGSIPRLDAGGKSKLVAIPGTPPDLFRPPAGCAFAPRCSRAMQVCLEMPPDTHTVEAEHSACCWLLHPLAREQALKNLEVQGG